MAAWCVQEESLGCRGGTPPARRCSGREPFLPLKKGTRIKPRQGWKGVFVARLSSPALAQVESPSAARGGCCPAPRCSAGPGCSVRHRRVTSPEEQQRLCRNKAASGSVCRVIKSEKKQSEEPPSRRDPTRAAGWKRGTAERWEMGPRAQPALGLLRIPPSAEDAEGRGGREPSRRCERADGWMRCP